jgi:hypothetical protein
MILWIFKLCPYIRRFKNEAGRTLDPERPRRIEIRFGDISQQIADAFQLLNNSQGGSASVDG